MLSGRCRDPAPGSPELRKNKSYCENEALAQNDERSWFGHSMIRWSVFPLGVANPIH